MLSRKVRAPVGRPADELPARLPAVPETRILMRNPNIESLLTKLLGQAKTDALFSTLNMPAILEEWEDGA